MGDLSKLCILPFIHQEIQQNGDVFVCCLAQNQKPLGNVKNNSPAEIWNSERLKEIRQLMLRGEWPSECMICKDSESFGQYSMRKSSNHYYKSSFNILEDVKCDGSMPSYQLRFIGLRHSNLCNLKCVYCDENYSTAWSNKPSSESLVTSFLNEDSLFSFIDDHKEHLTDLYIAGGEPLIDIRHLNFLKYLVKNNITDISIVYNTNISISRSTNNSLIQLWRKFKNVRCALSIDDFGRRFEFIRRNALWENVEKNILKLKSSGINVEFYITITNLNIFNLANFIEKMIEDYHCEYSDFDFNILREPKRLSINNLPLDVLENSKVNLKLFLVKLCGKGSQTIVLRSRIISLLKQLEEVQKNPNFFIDLTEDMNESEIHSFLTIFTEFKDSLPWPGSF